MHFEIQFFLWSLIIYSIYHPQLQLNAYIPQTYNNIINFSYVHYRQPCASFPTTSKLKRIYRMLHMVTVQSADIYLPYRLVRRMQNASHIAVNPLHRAAPKQMRHTSTALPIQSAQRVASRQGQTYSRNLISKNEMDELEY